MSEKERGSGIKSALEIAMERLEKKGVSASPLTASQKEAMAEIERNLKAKIAEEEILAGQSAAEARARGDLEKVDEIEAGKTDEINRLRRVAEGKKEKIRKQKV